jgi:hypothetical protein
MCTTNVVWINFFLYGLYMGGTELHSQPTFFTGSQEEQEKYTTLLVSSLASGWFLGVNGSGSLQEPRPTMWPLSTN